MSIPEDILYPRSGDTQTIYLRQHRTIEAAAYF